MYRALLEEHCTHRNLGFRSHILPIPSQAPYRRLHLLENTLLFLALGLLVFVHIVSMIYRSLAAD